SIPATTIRATRRRSPSPSTCRRERTRSPTAYDPEWAHDLDLRDGRADGNRAHAAHGGRLGLQHAAPSRERRAPGRDRAAGHRVHAIRPRPRAKPARLPAGARRPVPLRHVRNPRPGRRPWVCARDADAHDVPLAGFSSQGQGAWEPTMVHELAHNWFGNSVAPYAWSDLWLNEGHATWYEFNYAESKGQLVEDTENSPDPQGQATLDAVMRAVYAHGDEWRKDFGPVALPSSNKNTFSGLFSYNVYHGGALVLYALRQKIGTPAFERLERTWVQRYAGQSASTHGFIALAAEISGRS